MSLGAKSNFIPVVYAGTKKKKKKTISKSDNDRQSEKPAESGEKKVEKN